MDMEERLLRLERSHRIQRAAIYGMGVLGAILLLGAASSPRRIVVDRLEAHSVSVVSADGKNRVDLYATSDGFAGLGIAGLNGKQTAAIVVTPSGIPSLCFSDETTCRIVIGDVSGARNGSGVKAYSLQTRDKSGVAVWTAPAQ